MKKRFERLLAKLKFVLGYDIDMYISFTSKRPRHPEIFTLYIAESKLWEYSDGQKASLKEFKTIEELEEEINKICEA